MDNLNALYLDNDRQSDEYLAVNACGISTDESDGFGFVDRPNGREDHLLLLLTKGQMAATVEGRTYVMHPGGVLFYRPKQPQYYRAANGVPYETRWVHFSGTACDSLLESLRLNTGEPLMLRGSLEVEKLLSAMANEFILKKSEYEAVLAGQLQTLLGLVSRQVYTPEGTSRGNWNPMLESTRKLIYWRYQFPLDLEYMAGRCGLSVSRYQHLFKKQYAMSPLSYQIMLRVENAKSLLQSTTLSVREIAEKVGYTDQNYFSRVFKRYTGKVPTAYRK